MPNQRLQVIASQYILLESLREHGIALRDSIGPEQRLELEVMEVLMDDGSIVHEYGVSAIQNGIRENVLAELNGEERARNANRVSSLFTTTMAAFGQCSNVGRTLGEVEPEQFAFALIENRQQLLIRLSADFHPYTQLTCITEDDARKTRVFADAVEMARYARSGVLPAEHDDDDMFQRLCRTVSTLIGRVPVEREHIVAPLDPGTGTLYSHGDAGALVDLVLIGTLLRLQLSEHQFQHDTSMLFNTDSPVSLAELGLLVGLLPDEILRRPLADLGAIGPLLNGAEEERSQAIWIPRAFARQWLREQGTPGF